MPATNEQTMAEFEEHVRRFLGTLVAGLGHTAFNLPTAVMLGVFAKQAGFVAAASCVAEMADHLRLRAALKGAFAEGIKEAPMNMPPAAPNGSGLSAAAVAASLRAGAGPGG